MSYFKRIKPKMLLSLLATFVVVLGTFLVLVVLRTTALADEMATELSLNTAENYANQMAAVLNKTDNLVLGLKLAAEQFEEIPVEARRSYLDSVLEQTVAAPMSDITGAFICFEPNALDGMDARFQGTAESDATGRYVSYFFADAAGVSRDVVKAYDVPGEGDYYLVSFNTGKPYVTPPYSFEVNGELVTGITISYPLLNRDGVTVGVAGVDYAMDYFDILNDEVKLYDTGFGKFFTDQGITIAHPDKSLIHTVDLDWTESAEATAIRDTLQSGQSFVGKIYSPVLNTSTYKAFANVPMGNSGLTWVYATVVPESEVMATTNQLILLISLIGGFGLLAASVVIVLLANSIARPVRKMCEIAAHIADCDLTVTVPDKLRNSQDEIGELSRDLARMRDGLAETVSGINSASDSLQSQVNGVQTAIHVLNDRITDTSAATEELSAGMEETGASAEEMNATAGEIEHAVELVSEKSEDGAGRSVEIHTRAESLGKNVGISIEKSNRMFREIKQALEKALVDSKAVDEINALADAILGIASQTTLLALNASIEAARAGEAGRGFAVVANEISTLADNSKNTVSQIQAITKVVMSAVNALANSSTNLLNFVADNVQSDYQDMLQAADSYTNDAVYISDMTSDLNAASEELRASVQMLMKSINEVSQAAQEGARTTSAVAEQTSEISGNAATMTANIAETQITAEELTVLISKFKL